MTPKEKAKELYNRMYLTNAHPNSIFIRIDMAKRSALIAVDEIIKSEPRNPSDVDWDDVGGTHQYYYEAQREDALKYWKEVKQEIENL